MDWQVFSQHLSEHLNRLMQISTATPVSGGDIHRTYRLSTTEGDLFLKLNGTSSLALFETEAHSLQALSNSNTLVCPKVIGYGTFQNHAWLLMTHLDLVHGGDDDQRGRDLALMHQQVNDQSKPFGWFEDNFIGHTRQTNRWHFDWVDFYGQQRLLPQLELAQINGANRALYDLGVDLIDQLPYWFQSYTPVASLLHGDLWGGNSAFAKSEKGRVRAVVFDPASYYGDRETDIAMTVLFGGYSADFYRGYHAAFPLDSGYKSRQPLYNLYHLLNHFNLFGGHYQHQSFNTISQLLSQVR